MRYLVVILLALLLSALAPPPVANCAGTAISGLTEDQTPAVDDLVVTVDVSDASIGATGTNKKVQMKNLMRSGVSSWSDATWISGGVTLTQSDFQKTFLVSATTDFYVWLPGIDVSVSGYGIKFVKEGIGGITVYLTDSTEFIGNGDSGGSCFVPASSVTKVAYLELLVGPSGVTYIPKTTWPTSGTDRWYLSE